MSRKAFLSVPMRHPEPDAIDFANLVVLYGLNTFQNGNHSGI
jgi:hypothetical protein